MSRQSWPSDIPHYIFGFAVDAAGQGKEVLRAMLSQGPEARTHLLGGGAPWPGFAAGRAHDSTPSGRGSPLTYTATTVHKQPEIISLTR